MNTSTRIRQQSGLDAPMRGSSNSIFERFTELFHQRLNALLLVKQINHMIKAVQRHRGMSLGLLGGNSQFRDEFLGLQQQINARLNLLGVFAAESKNLLAAKDQENLQSAWLTISNDWQEDSVIDNYELHCHLIEQLLVILGSIAKQLEQPMAAILASQTEPSIVNASGTIYPNRLRQLEVLHFSTRLMPAVAEQIGRIRALSTYIAALGFCDAAYASKLKYVIQCTKVNNEKLRHQAKRMEPILEKDNQLLVQLKSYEIKLGFLLDMIENDVLKEGRVIADSNKLFDLASDIIDMYLSIVDEGLVLLEKWHQDEVENFLIPTTK